MIDYNAKYCNHRWEDFASDVVVNNCKCSEGDREKLAVVISNKTA